MPLGCVRVCVACVVPLASSSAMFLTGQADGHRVMSRSGILQ